MDKYEYKLRQDEIKSLIKQKEFQKAVEIADSIDWTRVRSVTTLCTISDLYKINRRYKEAKVLLEQAYERYPNGRMIVYSLCELSIKMDEIVQAIEYYKQFVQMAPMDEGKFILQYKIYEAQDVSLEERIGVLEELAKRVYKEKWLYELAYLYHRIGLVTKCIEECDIIITWFKEGAYVKKAMELKMLHQELTENQMSLYESMLPPKEREAFTSPIKFDDNNKTEEDDIQVKTMDMSKYNTINLQRELAESMKDVLVADEGFAPLVPDSHGNTSPGVYIPDDFDVEKRMGNTERMSRTLVGEEAEAATPSMNTISTKAPMKDTGEMEELFFEDSNTQPVAKKEEKIDYDLGDEETKRALDIDTTDLPPYDPVKDLELTMMYDPTALPDELREAEEENLDTIDEEAVEEAEVPKVGFNTEELINLDETVEIVEPIGSTKVFNKADLQAVAKAYNSSLKEDAYGFTFDNDPNLKKNEDALEDHIKEDITGKNKEELLALIDQRVKEALEKALEGSVRPQYPAAMYGEPSKEMGKVLSQDYDGQISMVVPDVDEIEKQITGQLDFEDILNEWENTKKMNQIKNEASLAKRVLEETGSLFTRDEIQQLDGIYERLERGESDVDTEAEYERYLAELRAEEEAKAAAEEAEKRAKEEAAAKEKASEEVEIDEQVSELVEESEPEEEIEVEEPEIIEESEEEELPEVEDIAEVEEVDEVSEEEIKEAEAQTTVVEEELEEESEEEYPEVEEIEDEPSDEVIEEDEEDEEEVEEPKVEEKAKEVPVPDKNVSTDESSDEDRMMSEDELALFAQFAQTKRARQNLLHSLDKISLAAYTGNIFVTGDSQEEAIELAKNVIRYVQSTDHNFSGKIAKVSGEALNNKMISVMVEKLANGGLIIEKASGMSAETTKNLLKALNQERTGIVVALEDTTKAMQRMMEYFEGMKQIFNVHIEVEELSDDALVAYGKKYAEHLEYSIDDMGILALHTRIDEMQTSDHIVTVTDVREIIDEAIEKANKKSLKHFTDILFAKRYDDEDMIILRENDFIG